jgi:hypothetical protein
LWGIIKGKKARIIDPKTAKAHNAPGPAISKKG